MAQSLRQAFASERDVRLPRLRDVTDADGALHAAHSLPSSAWVVGEPEISRLARSVEEHLEAGAAPTDLAELVRALERYEP
jgi:HPt (histidine-containing phosphotransfer) domain-containing protein